jgi:hypothetical protein
MPASVSLAAERAELRLSIDSPQPGAVIGDPGGTVFVAGQALAMLGEYQPFDIVFVVDTSESTSAPSGADIDGDGKVGERRGGQWLTVFGRVLPLGNSDGGDSVLAAEVAAVRVLLEQLDPRSTRVGLVTFSGDHDAMTADSRTVQRLTSDFDEVREGLDRVLSDGPNGMTDMASGVSRGIAELLGSDSAYSEKREGARRIMIFLTDGNPTLPYLGSPAQNARTTISRAVMASKAKIRIDTYAIGDEALEEPVVAVEMARVTTGDFTPVRDPRNLRAVFEDVSFAEIERLRVRNRTTGADASYQAQQADGSFAALVPVREGENELEVHARSTDGSEALRTVRVRFLAGREAQPLTPRQVALRNRLLEKRLADLRRGTIEVQAERDARVQQELRVEIEKEREASRARADEARRRLKIEAE